MIAPTDAAPRWGLSAEIITDLLRVFAQNARVERVLLFGSRAMGTYKNGSDIDLALFGTYLTPDDLTDLRTRLDALPYAYTYDLIDYARSSNPALKAAIDDMGLPFYEQQRTQLPEGWHEYTLGEIAEINPKVSLKQGQEYSFVEMKDLNPSLKYVQPSAIRELKGGAKFQDGDTLFARITPCLENGKISQVRGLKNEVGFGSTEFLVLRGKTGLSNTDFIYHLSRTEYVREKAIQAMTGTSGRQRVEKSALEKIPVILPPLETQQEIAAILSALDDKIELNRQMNQTLETIAQTLFTEWFVKFNFPGFDGELVDDLPKGWRRGTLGELIKVQNGYAFKSNDFRDQGDFGVIKIKNINSGLVNVLNVQYVDNFVIMNISNRFKVQESDVLIAMTGAEVGKVGIVPFASNTLWLNQRVGKVVDINGFSKWYAYTIMKSDESYSIFQNVSVGSAQPNISASQIESINLVVPDLKILESFNNTVGSLYDRILANFIDNQTLTQLRDTLLPRLLSGKIAVGIAGEQPA